MITKTGISYSKNNFVKTSSLIPAILGALSHLKNIKGAVSAIAGQSGTIKNLGRIANVTLAALNPITYAAQVYKGNMSLGGALTGLGLDTAMLHISPSEKIFNKLTGGFFPGVGSTLSYITDPMLTNAISAPLINYVDKKAPIYRRGINPGGLIEYNNTDDSGVNNLKGEYEYE
jgi:hypothetical protein